jgi:hypothetical protein
MGSESGLWTKLGLLRHQALASCTRLDWTALAWWESLLPKAQFSHSATDESARKLSLTLPRQPGKQAEAFVCVWAGGTWGEAEGEDSKQAGCD